MAFPFVIFHLFGGDMHEKEGIILLQSLISPDFSFSVSLDAYAGIIKCLLCKFSFRSGGVSMQEDDFVRIAKLLSNMFADIRGWVVTDIAAGVALVKGRFVQIIVWLKCSI
jgi:hypothetical protein